MRLGLIALGALLAGCASASPPPGGPEDKTPPKVLRVTPDTNALNVRDDHVSFFFDEVINDRGSGTQEVGSFFLVSPSDGTPRVSWHRSRIDVKPRHGFRANTAYVVTMLPGLTDLRNNLIKDGATVSFSTGATIPKERITGIAFDWAAERPAAKAFIEAITPDSIIYQAQADSTGKFTVGPLPAGKYLLRAIIDANNNRALDRTESFDSVTVTVPQAKAAELLAASRDTFPTRLLSVSVRDSLSIVATFDRPIEPTQALSAAQFTLVGADSAQIELLSAASPRTERAADSVLAQVKLDSARRADSLAGKPVANPQPAVTPRLPGGRAPTPPARPSLPPPYTTIALKLRRPLALNSTYRLTARDVKALNARSQTVTRSFTTPKTYRAPGDSTRVSADSARRLSPPPDTTRRAPTPPTSRP